MMAGWTMGTEAWLLMGAWAFVMVLAVWVLIREPRPGERPGPPAPPPGPPPRRANTPGGPDPCPTW